MSVSRKFHAYCVADPRECQGHRALRFGHEVTIHEAEKRCTVAMAAMAMITSATIATSITIMPVPMITARCWWWCC